MALSAGSAAARIVDVTFMAGYYCAATLMGAIALVVDH
jgi:hypothetical protein